MSRRRRSNRRVNAKGRNEGEGQYALLPYAMLLSPAWLSLSGPATRVWLLLRCRFNGGNNGQLILSLEEAARLLRLGKATVLDALRELEEKALIVCTRRGQWYGRLASTWAVTDKGVNGEQPTNAWRHWRPSKTECGFNTDPSGPAMGRYQNPSPRHGSVSAPVSGISDGVMGSITDR